MKRHLIQGFLAGKYNHFVGFEIREQPHSNYRIKSVKKTKIKEEKIKTFGKKENKTSL